MNISLLKKIHQKQNYFHYYNMLNFV